MLSSTEDLIEKAIVVKNYVKKVEVSSIMKNISVYFGNLRKFFIRTRREKVLGSMYVPSRQHC